MPPTFDYTPDRVYTLNEFERFNDWLKTHDFVIDGTPVNHFERDTKGRLIPMPQTTLDKEPVVSEIARQVGDWNIHTRQNGVVTTSQGGYRFIGDIRAPDVAFLPKGIYRGLTHEQLSTFQGPAFCPTFAVEVENFQTGNNEVDLIAKFKQTYFPAGLELGLMVDPINRKVFYFRRDADGVVRRREHLWFNDDGEATVVSGCEVLPGFRLKLWKIDEVTSQVRFVQLLLNANPLTYGLVTGLFGV